MKQWSKGQTMAWWQDGKTFLCAIRLFQLLVLNLYLVSGRIQLNETDQNQLLRSPKWFCDSTVARAKTEVPAWESIFAFGPVVGGSETRSNQLNRFRPKAG